MTRAEILAAFDALPPYRRYQALRIAVGDALRRWRDYRLDGVPLAYRDSIVGAPHTVDDTLPARALVDVDAMLGGAFASAAIVDAYLEPITAMHDGDLDLPGDIELAYYAIYNLHRLIARQVSSASASAADEHVVFAQVCGAISATEAWVTEWWTRVWDAWACTPDLPATPRLSATAFEALARGDLAGALGVLDDDVMHAIVRALSGDLSAAVSAAAVGLGAALTPEVRSWLEAHLFELAPDAIAVDPVRRRYVVIRSTRCEGWDLVANAVVPLERAAEGSLYRLVRFQHDGAIWWRAGERIDAQGAWASFIEGQGTAEIWGSRSLAALGRGVIAHHASRGWWSSQTERDQVGEVAVLGAAIDDRGSVVATHDGVRVSIWNRDPESPSCARITGPAAPRTLAIGGRELLVVWVDGSATIRRFG